MQTGNGAVLMLCRYRVASLLKTFLHGVGRHLISTLVLSFHLGDFARPGIQQEGDQQAFGWIKKKKEASLPRGIERPKPPGPP